MDQTSGFLIIDFEDILEHFLISPKTMQQKILESSQNKYLYSKNCSETILTYGDDATHGIPW